MSPRRSVPFCLLALALGGCGSSDNEKVIEDQQGQNCRGTSYLAFDPANHAAQDQRVEAQVTFRSKVDAAVANPSKAAATFGEIEGLYASTAELRAEVQALGNNHFPDDPNAKSEGSRIDVVITDGITRGKAATKALDVAIAGHLVDEGLTRFFYLYVFHEIAEGERVAYDEGYGTLGTGPDNVADKLRSIAALAKEMDELNGTDYEPRLFAAIRDGSCKLDKALKESGAESVDWKTNEAYGAVVTEIDTSMTEVLALAVGHEFTELEVEQDLDAATEEFYEGAHLFFALEAAMRAKGGTAEANAAEIASTLNAVTNDIETGQTTWKMKVDAAKIRDQVAAAFGVTPKG